jgi:ribosomal protein L36
VKGPVMLKKKKDGPFIYLTVLIKQFLRVFTASTTNPPGNAPDNINVRIYTQGCYIIRRALRFYVCCVFDASYLAIKKNTVSRACLLSAELWAGEKGRRQLTALRR